MLAHDSNRASQPMTMVGRRGGDRRAAARYAVRPDRHARHRVARGLHGGAVKC